MNNKESRFCVACVFCTESDEDIPYESDECIHYARKKYICSRVTNFSLVTGERQVYPRSCEEERSCAGQGSNKCGFEGVFFKRKDQEE